LEVRLLLQGWVANEVLVVELLLSSVMEVLENVNDVVKVDLGHVDVSLLWLIIFV
jgi:hypothetical protein